MDANKLAVLVNQVELDQASKILDVPQSLIKKALEGENLTPYENAKLETGFNRIYLKDDIPERYELDLDYLFGTGEQIGLLPESIDVGITEALDITERYIDDPRQFDVIRQAVAYGDITLEQLEAGYGLFAELPPSQVDKVTDRLTEPGAREAFEKMVDAYLEDVSDGGSIWDIEDSAFWEWFRSEFYVD